MAAAYGRASGQPAVVAVTRGPGASNALIGIHEAAQACSPVVLIVGQIESKMLGRRALQAMEFERVFASVTKKAIEVASPEQVTPAIMAALRLAAAPEQGPVVVSVPADYWYGTVEGAPADIPLSPVSTTPVLSEDALTDLAALMNGASAGLIVAGAAFRGGHQAELLGRLAQATGFGVVGGHGFPDALPTEHDYWLGCSTIRGSETLKKAFGQADAMVFLDHWPGDRVTQGYLPLPRRLAVVSATPTSGWDEYPQARTFVGDPLAAVSGLLNYLTPAKLPQLPQWLRKLKTEAARQASKILDASRVSSTGVAFADILAALDDCLPERTTLVSDAGSFNDWFMRFFPFRAGREYLGTLSGSMGYAVPAAIGAHLARPEARTVALTGDGGFLMTGLEMASLAQWRIPATVLVFQNGLWGSIALHQDREFPNDRFATQLPRVSIVGVARSLGVDGYLVEDAASLQPALSRALSSDGPSLVEIVTDGDRPSPASYESLLQ